MQLGEVQSAHVADLQWIVFRTLGGLWKIIESTGAEYDLNPQSLFRTKVRHAWML
jgi:hypothetical protein